MMRHQDSVAREQQQRTSKKQKTEKMTPGEGEHQKTPPRWPFFQSNLNPFSNSSLTYASSKPISLSYSNKSAGDCALTNIQVQPSSPSYRYNPLTSWFRSPQKYLMTGPTNATDFNANKNQNLSVKPFQQTPNTAGALNDKKTIGKKASATKNDQIDDTNKSTSTDTETTMQQVASKNNQTIADAKFSSSSDPEAQTVVGVERKQATANTESPTLTLLDKQPTINVKRKQEVVGPKMPTSTTMETKHTFAQSPTDFGTTILKSRTESQLSKHVTGKTKTSTAPKTIVQNTNIPKASGIITNVLATSIVGNVIKHKEFSIQASHTLATEALSKTDVHDASAQNRKICNSALDATPIKNGNQTGKIASIFTAKNQLERDNLSRCDCLKTNVLKDTAQPIDNNLKEISQDSSIFITCTSEADVVKIKMEDLRCWSANEHSHFLRLITIHGLDFQKIAESMTNRDFANVRAYAYYAFTGESLAHWSVEEYERFLQHVPTLWIGSNWSKSKVIDRIRKKSELKANGTLTAERPSVSDKKDLIDEKSHSSSSVNSTVAGEAYENAHSNHWRPIEIKKNDVLHFLSGKSDQEILHPGNVHFRKLVYLRKKEYTQYDSLKDRDKKREIVTSIIGSIKRLDPPGRFLKFNKRGRCICMSDDEIFMITRTRIHSMLKSHSDITEGRSSVITDEFNGRGRNIYDQFKTKVPTTKTEKNIPTAIDDKTTHKRCMLELASFNEAPPLNQDDDIFYQGKRPRRKRQTVRFFEPGDTKSKQSRKRKRVEHVVDNTVPSKTMKLRSRTAAKSTLATSQSTSLRSSLPKRRTPTAKRKVIRRLSQKASRRVVTNALVGFLQRSQTSSPSRR